MFGYIVVNKPEMKIKDFDRYREYYCGVCHNLGNRYGTLGRISLSYDSAFMVVLLTALYEPKTKMMESCCVVHPVGKKKYLCNYFFDYVADMNLLLSFYKCEDDWKDDKNLIKLGYSKFLKKNIDRIRKEYPHKDKYIKDKLCRLYKMEKHKMNNIDVLSNLFGDIMGELMAVAPVDIFSGKKDSSDDSCFGEQWKQELRNIGFYLGKFVYILDAFDDLEEDYKRGQFNPFLNKYKQAMQNSCYTMEDLENYVKTLLMMSASRMAGAYERLPILKETAILRNIIYSGIWTKYFRICKRRNKE